MNASPSLVPVGGTDPHVLLIESNAQIAYEITDLLLRASDAYHVHGVASLQEAFDALQQHAYDAIVLDAQAASVHAVAPVLTRLAQRSREVPVLVLTTSPEERWAVEAINRGATQVLVRGARHLPDLARAVGVALERRRMAHRLTLQASRDRLTQLANRATLSRAVQQAVSDCAQRRSRFALMLLDLDGFKAVNDTLGHAAGDEALRRVAQRLRNEIGGCDLVARLGGDEFSLLVSDVGDLWHPLGVAERVLEVVSRPMQIAGVPVTLGCRIGIALFPQSGRTEAALLKAADEAMYAAKGSHAAIRLHLPDGMPQWHATNRDTLDAPVPTQHRDDKQVA